MCGIAGYWSPSQRHKVDQSVLAGMTKILKHRGPDGFGFHQDPELGLAMGHARLSINDLKTGEQPLEQGPLVLTANGEFYNFREIRADLSARGATFNCKSDSEIALKLYERYGLDFVHHLRGEFAFTLADKRRRELLLVRDRFGIRPLFYYCDGDVLVYGSEIKALLKHPAVKSDINPQAVLHQLMQTMVPGMTLFKGIKALKPGHILIAKYESGKLVTREQPYWDFSFPEKEAHHNHLPEEDIIAQVRETLVDAIRVRLEADVAVGAYLSGGIDSCCILGLSAAMRQDPVMAFTIGFDNATFDETAIAREMAESIGAEHIVLPLSHEQLYGDNYENALWHSERTFYNTLGVAKYCLSRTVNEHGIKVVVTGEGSDELFAGYPFFKKDYLTLNGSGGGKGGHDQIFHGAMLSGTAVSHPAFEKLCGFTPSWVQNWMQTYQYAKSLLSQDFLQQIGDYDPISALAESFDAEQIRGRHPLDIAQYTWSKTMLEGQILNWGGDRVDMAHSMESRPAFLDHKLVELAVTIPPSLRIKGQVEKWVLREAVRGVLPETLYKRQKFPFMAPPSHTQRKPAEPLQHLLTKYLSSGAIKDAGIADGKAVQSLIGNTATADQEKLFRRDILLNHFIGIHYLNGEFASKVAAFS